MRLRRERALCPFPVFLLVSVASGPIISTARPDRKRPVPPYPLPRRPPTFRGTTDRTLRALGSRRDRPDNPARIVTKDTSVAGKHTAQKTDHRIPDTKPEKTAPRFGHTMLSGPYLPRQAGPHKKRDKYPFKRHLSPHSVVRPEGKRVPCLRADATLAAGERQRQKDEYP